MDTLKKIKLVLPADKSIEEKFLSLFANFGEYKNREVVFTPSSDNLLPLTAVGFQDDVVTPKAVFECEKTVFEMEIANKTGEIRKSPHKYEQIELTDFLNRIINTSTNRLDHIGFNIPWFDGVAPEILKLREEMANKSLYYLFPTGENWDFIIPGNEQEIISNSEPDLSLPRYPKVEIVSFEKCSTPLMQFDFSIKERSDTIIKKFPEGIADPELKNIWIYIKNSFGIDICFVVGEDQGDWSKFLSGHRLISKQNKS